MPYSIEVTGVADNDLQGIKRYYRQQIIDAIKQQLAHEPTVETKNKKMLVEYQPDFEYEPPVWRLRVGEYRVFYDVNEGEMKVVVRAVRHKPPHATTEEIT
jgi:mRNA-degrading endonuclease RelE of RelBE toxin-antitoxin system